MSNWGEDPIHNKESFGRYALPRILQGECLRYCVEPANFKSEKTKGEIDCMENCQMKTVKSFDLYIEVSQRLTA
jgi:hypothetical protein